MPRPHETDHLTIFAICCLACVIATCAGCSQNSHITPASAIVGGKLTLSWKDVPGAASYHLYLSRSPGVTKFNGYKIHDATNPITIVDLQPGITYYFVVTVVTGSGESDESREFSYTAADKPGFMDLGDLSNHASPDQTPDQSGIGQVTLTWDNVPNAVSYNIYWKDSPGVTKHNGNKTAAVKNPHTIKGLRRGVTYYFVVTAVNEFGESAESQEFSFTAK
jgi:Fibronectin type III domain